MSSGHLACNSAEPSQDIDIPATPWTTSFSKQGSSESQSIPFQQGLSTAESLHDIGTLAIPSATVEETS